MWSLRSRWYGLRIIFGKIMMMLRMEVTVNLFVVLHSNVPQSCVQYATGGIGQTEKPAPVSNSERMIHFWISTLTSYSIFCGNKFFCILWSCIYYLIFISVQMEVGHRSRPNWPDSKYVAIGPWIFVYWLMDRQQGKVIRYSYSQGCIKCPSVGI